MSPEGRQLRTFLYAGFKALFAVWMPLVMASGVPENFLMAHTTAGRKVDHTWSVVVICLKSISGHPASACRGFRQRAVLVLSDAKPEGGEKKLETFWWVVARYWRKLELTKCARHWIGLELNNPQRYTIVFNENSPPPFYSCSQISVLLLDLASLVT